MKKSTKITFTAISCNLLLAAMIIVGMFDINALETIIVTMLPNLSVGIMGYM